MPLFPILMMTLVLFMRFGPDIQFKRLLNDNLVERPLHWLADMKRHDLIFIIVLTGMLIGGAEIMLIFGPEFMVLYAADLAVYLDAMAISYLTAAHLKVQAASRAVRMAFAQLGCHLARLFRAKPRKRVSRPVTPSRADNDDEDGGRLLRLAA